MIDSQTKLAPTDPPPTTTTSTTPPPIIEHVNVTVSEEQVKKFADEQLDSLAQLVIEEVCSRKSKNKFAEDCPFQRLFGSMREKMLRVVHNETLVDTLLEMDDLEPLDEALHQLKKHALPVKVRAAISVESIDELDENEGEFTMNYRFKSEWIINEESCTRSLLLLVAAGIEVNSFKTGGSLRIRKDFLDSFWWPLIYPFQAIKVEDRTIQATDGLGGFPLITVRRIPRIYDENSDKKFTCSVTMLSRMTAVIHEEFDLSRFPHDSQNIKLNFIPWIYDAKRLILNWTEGNALKSEQLFLNSFLISMKQTRSKPFKIPHLTRGEAAKAMRGEKIETYSSIGIEISLVRKISSQLMSVYIPSTLLVIISLVALWFPFDNVRDRATVGSIAVLALISVLVDLQSTMPSASTVNWIEVYLLVCTFFVTAQMSTSIIIHFVYDNKKFEFQRKIQADRVVSLQNLDNLSVDELEAIRRNRLFFSMCGQVPRTFYESPIGLREMRQTDEVHHFHQSNFISELFKWFFKVDIAYNSSAYLPTVIDVYTRVIIFLSFVAFFIWYWLIAA